MTELPLCVGLRSRDRLRELIKSLRKMDTFSRTCSQVFSTGLHNPPFCFTFVAVILSFVLIICSHLVLISLMEWCFSCMTRSHHRTHIRCADSDIRIWRSRHAPLSLLSCWFCWSLLGWSAIFSSLMLPHPRIRSMLIVGHSYLLLGQ